jgi:uncharacterized protein HemY
VRVRMRDYAQCYQKLTPDTYQKLAALDYTNFFINISLNFALIMFIYMKVICIYMEKDLQRLVQTTT